MTILRILFARSWALVVIAVAAGIASGLASAAVIALLPSAVTGGAVARAQMWAFAGLAVLAAASRAVSQIVLARLGHAAIAELRSHLARRILAAPLRRIEELGGHRLLATLTEDAAAIAQAYAYVPLVCANGATVAGCLAYLAWVSPATLGLAVAAMAVGTVVFQLHQRRAAISFTRARETSDELYRQFRALTAGIKDLKLHRRRGARFVADLLAPSLAGARRHHVAGTTAYSLAMAWAMVLFYAVVGLAAFALPAVLGAAAAATAAATLALLYLMAPFATLVELLPAVARATVALRTIDQLGVALQAEPAEAADTGGRARPWPAFQRVELAGVTHCYHREHGDPGFQLGPIDLVLRPGEIVYLVGGNGSGKTTLALLLLGLYVPETGTVRVDGATVDDENRERYRELFSAVFADYHVFDSLLGAGGSGLDERREEMRGGDPTGFAGGAGSKAPRGIDERSEEMRGGDPTGFAGGAGSKAPRGIDERSEEMRGGDPTGFAGGAGSKAPRGIDGVVSYGGGATHVRIVVDKALLELTMGELVEAKPDEAPALWPDWAIAAVIPAAGAKLRRAVSSAVHRGRKPHAASHIAVRKPLGQAATLLGYVVASPGELVPLISDNPHDLAVVRALLSEHYPWDAPDPDDEFDPTDPTDKDLLFGALVRELGAIQRRDCELDTLKLALGRRVARLGSRAAARLADLYPALNFARDHLVQYLHYRWSGTTDLLTARARSDRLHDTSIRILQQLREPPGPHRGRPRSVRRRLIWLSWFVAEPIIDRWDTWSRRLVAVAAIAALVAVAGVIVKQSVDYHPTYVERIENWIEAQRRAALEDSDHSGPSDQPGQPEQPVQRK